MKAIEQSFHVVLFSMLYKMVPSHKSVGEPQCVTIQMKAIEKTLETHSIGLKYCSIAFEVCGH